MTADLLGDGLSADRVACLLNDASRTMAAPEAATATGLDLPGLYSWWVDPEGAAELSLGLGLPIEAGLIYAGQAGATRTRSGKASTNTLRGRLVGMHLGGRRRFSTFRRTLGAILDAGQGPDEPGLSEPALTAWMKEHLRVAVVGFASGDGLAAVESELLTRLDPPLNLAGRPRTPVRSRLTTLRRAASPADASGPTPGRRTYRTLDGALADFPSWPPANQARIREVIAEDDYSEIYKPARSFYLALKPKSGGPVVRINFGYIAGISDPRTGEDGIALPINDLRDGDGPRSVISEPRAICPTCFMELPVSGTCGQCG